MRPARASSVVLVAAVTAAVAWFLLDVWSRQGGARPPLPWPAALGPLAVAVVVLVLARDVRRRRLAPLVAARVAVLAKASAYGGALLVGWYAAQAIELLTQLTAGRRTPLIVAGVSALACAALAAAGLVAQRWCRLPPDDSDDDAGGLGSPADDAGAPRAHP